MLVISGGPREGRGRFLVVIPYPGFGKELAMPMPSIKCAKIVVKIEYHTAAGEICVHICGHSVSTNVDAAGIFEARRKD
jgi:hypothetical protein